MNSFESKRVVSRYLLLVVSDKEKNSRKPIGSTSIFVDEAEADLILGDDAGEHR
jgi:hypothetical protein